MHYFVYILKSLKSDKVYVGYTSRLKDRILEHNIKNNLWTSQNKPWKMIYYESFTCKKCALEREKFFKTGYGRNLINCIIRTDPFNLIETG
jgi:putative endonuclease